MSNSRKYQIRNAGVGADLASGTNNYKLNRTTGAYDTYTDDASVTTTDIVIIGKKSNISDRLDAVEKNITVLAAAAFLTDAEDGIAGSYTIANKLATARTIALSGDVTGSVTFDGSSNATISTTIGANTVALGTDTTGNYVATVTAGSGITVSGSGSETAAVTVGIDSTVALKADTHYIGTTSVALNRTSANLALTGISSVTLPGSTSGTVQLIPTAAVGTDTVLTIPATTGTIVTTGDTGTVTNTMLAGSIANAKLANSTISGVQLGSNLNTLTIGTGLSGTSYNGTAGVTIANTGVLSVNGSTGAVTGIANSTDVHYIGTTSVALNRASANLALTGISSVTLPGSTSGTVQLVPTAAVGTGTVLTIPATTGTIVTTGDSSTVTNTMLAGSIANAKLANSSVTVGTTAISLGSSSTTLAGLTSVTSTAFTGALTGNASTATTLQTARAINGVSFNGSADVTVHTAGTGISISGTTVTNTGVTSIAGTTNQITASASTGGVTLSLPSAVTLPGDLTVTGNLTVNGSTTTISASNISLSDSIIYLASGNSGNSADIGTVGHFNNGTYQHTGLVRRASDSKWYLFSGVVPEPSTTIDFTTWTKDTLLANIEGNTTGTHTGAVTGNASTATTLQTARLINGVSFNGSADITVHTAGTGIGISGTTVTNTGVTSAAVSGTGLSINASTGGVTITSNATSANTGSTIVARDAGGNFTAGTITAALSGNATTATTLQTARLINGVSFNGSADVTVHTAGTGISVSGTTVTNTGIISASAGTGISVSGTNPLTITNTGVTSLVAGTNIAISGSTGAVTVSVTGTVANATNATTATAVSNTVTGTNSAELVRGNMGDNDQARILVGATASNAGYLEIATADDGTEPIYVRQYTGVFSTLSRTATILDGSGNTTFPGSVTASSFVGNVSGTASSISGYNNPTTAATANTIVYRDGSGHITGNYGFYGYLNTSDDVNTGSITYIMAKFGDNYHRSASAAKVAAFISGQSMNISGSSTSCSGNSSTATTATNTSGGTVNGNYLGVHNTSGSTGYGLSLYNGAVAGQPTYGIFFGQTASFGTHGNVTADWATYFTMDATANRGWIFRDVSNGNKASISNTGNATFAGEVTAYSDARLKTNIVTIDKALDKVVKLRGVYFDKDGKRQIGVIAQEIREVFPEVVGEANDEMKTLHVNHGAMVGALIESTKDLNDKIEAQAKEIAELKALVQQLLSTK